jgi:hypothetical protein
MAFDHDAQPKLAGINKKIAKLFVLKILFYLCIQLKAKYQSAVYLLHQN